MAKTICKHLLIAVCGLALGFAAGFAGLYLSAKWSWERQSSPEAARVRAVFPTLARVGMMTLFASHAENPSKDLHEQLLEFSEELSRMKQVLGPSELRQVVSMNLGYSYLQLARLERENGRGEQAEHLTSRAQAEFQSLGWRDVSQSALNAALDRHRPTDSRRKKELKK